MRSGREDLLDARSDNWPNEPKLAKRTQPEEHKETEVMKVYRYLTGKDDAARQGKKGKSRLPVDSL